MYSGNPGSTLIEKISVNATTTNETDGIPAEDQGKKEKFFFFFIPDDKTENFICVSQMHDIPLPVTFSMINSPVGSSSSASIAAGTTPKVGLKELCLKWIDGIKQTNTNTQKRRKVNSYGAVVNGPEDFEGYWPAKKSKSIQSVKNKEPVESTNNEEEATQKKSILEDESSREESSSEVACKMLKLNRPTFLPKSEHEACISLPVLEKGWFFTAIYYPGFNKKKKPKVYLLENCFVII